MSDMQLDALIPAYGLSVTITDLAHITGMSRNSVRKWLALHDFYSGNERAAEALLKDNGIYDAEDLHARLGDADVDAAPGMSDIELENVITAFGMRLTVIQMACMTHMSRNTVRRYLKMNGFYSGNSAAPEGYLIDHGLTNANAVMARLKKISLEHPEWGKQERPANEIRFGRYIPPEPKPKKMTYTQKLKALGFEPWPSDYELEARGER